MAKYVRNRLDLSGDPERLSEIAEQLKGTQEHISFEKIIPAEGAGQERRKELWGTPEDAQQTDMVSYRDGTALEYTFDTEKTAPVPVFRRLAEMYPELDMTVSYACEDPGNSCGIYDSPAGSSEIAFREPDDPFVFACDVWDLDPDEEMNELEINFAEE